MVKSGGELLISRTKIASILLVSGLSGGLLSGCLNNAAYSSLEGGSRPVSNAKPATAPPVSNPSSTRNPGQYRVQRGDTLYSIAFRYGLDYKKLAHANNIGSHYTIYVGQTLALREASPPASPTTVTKPQAAARPQTTPSQTVTKVNSQEADVKVSTTSTSAGGNLSWDWPHNGKIVRTYNPNLSERKGVDLVGQIGDSVRAAARGTVVYAGNGLPGYGNLIILEHGDSLLSAYAFNQELLVAERDQVEKGQVIARMGKQGDQPGLHFEIRREGKPVDPMGYLPQR